MILAACTSGLRTLFLSREEEPAAEGLRAMVPMNIRQGSEQLALGNRISSLFVTLPCRRAGRPRRAWRRIVEHTGALKSSGAALGAATMLDLASVAPPVLHASVARSLYATRLFNLTITNVPGPRVPLYAFGAPTDRGAADRSAGRTSRDRDRDHLLRRADRRRDQRRPRFDPRLDVLACGVEAGFAELCDLLPDATDQAGPAALNGTPPGRGQQIGLSFQSLPSRTGSAFSWLTNIACAGDG